MPKTNTSAFVVWEESMPLVQLVDFLTVNHYAAVISPVHDKDVYTREDVKRWRESQELLHGVYIEEGQETFEKPTGELVTGNYGQALKKTVTTKVPKEGDLKKPHRHVFVQLDYSAPLSVWLALFKPLDVHYVETVKSRRGYLRYLCHLDNPEKARYRECDVIQLGGVDISCIYEKTQRDSDNLEIRILNVIADNKIEQITKLQQYLLHVAKDMDAYREVKAHYGYWAAYMRNLFYASSVVRVGTPQVYRLNVDADGVVAEEGGRDVAPDAA